MTELSRAEAEVRAARARLLATLAETQQRVSPSTLAQEAADAAKHGALNAARRGAEQVRARPVAAMGVAGAALLFLARRPIFRALAMKPGSPPGV